MKAVICAKSGPPDVLQYTDVPTPEPRPGQARVRLRAAALNHRDLWQRRRYDGTAPMIFGSDGAGVVDAVGDAADAAWVGREVIVNPMLHWGDREDAPRPGWQTLGNPTPGTYAEAAVVPVENLAPKPPHLSFVQAAAVPLAGLTAWRALFTQGMLRPGQTVFVPGIGGGVAGWALAFARAAGARVLVSSSSDEKLAKAAARGADGGVNYTRAEWERELAALAGEDGVDLVLDTAGARSLPAALRAVRVGGRVVFLGVTSGAELTLNVRDMFYKQVHLVGTTMGSPREFAAMCRFVRLHRLVPEVHAVYPLARAAAAQAAMEAGVQFGKIVLEV
jgi:zinc-binding alcohol dehydrogenase/oxidoreductase